MRFNKKIAFQGIIISILIIAALIFYYSPPKEAYLCPDCNLVVISVTNLRADHLSYNNYFRETSPNIDKFSEEGMVFDNAFSHASWTLPSGASFFTSLYPLSHGLMDRYSGEFLSQDIVTLTDILNSNKYNTAAFTGGFDYSLRFNVVNRFSETEIFDKIFESNTDRFAFRKVGVPSKDNETELSRHPKQTFGLVFDFSSSIPAAMDWMEKNQDKKFFMFVQGFDTHCPFTPPPPYDKMFDSGYKGYKDFSSCVFTYDTSEQVLVDGKETYFANQFQWDDKTGRFIPKNVSLDEDDVEHLVALYDAEIRATDDLVGNLLDKVKELGISDKTIIVFLSEHGDQLGEKGRFMRGGPLKGTFYDRVIHVPLIIKHPNLEPKRVNGLVQLIDVMPSLLRFLDIKAESKMEGKSLLPLILNDKPVNEFVFANAEFTPYEENPFFKIHTLVASIRSDEWKLIREKFYLTPEKDFIDHINYELYNIKKDPKETENVFKENKDVYKKMDKKLSDFLNGLESKAMPEKLS